MITILNEQPTNTDEKSDIVAYLPNNHLPIEQTLATALTHPNPTTQWLLSSKLAIHLPEVGLNPIADAAAYLFSLMGRLIHLKSHTNLNSLYSELVHEIENFQATVEAYSHNTTFIAEYLPITCYALCATLDDIIASTPWGGQGKWDPFSLVKTFIPEPPSQISFFIILERLIRDPDIYIDVIEFMYLCLSFGFKCRNQAGLSEFDHDQLEQITHSLYKRIRSFRGNFSKTLSPFPLKTHRPTPKTLSKKKIAVLIGLCFCSLILILWTTSAYLLKPTLETQQTISNSSL